ncbi:PAS domain-containing hybrid sensor histidine kinase/response regulator, partial [Sphingomonas sp. CROZ-RG-20F-R02-07]|uniref:hybrid sensor histidine kinase/response regulator n=1 Tax=Sphingomonas sp. CROZ-RG-20F-R02-07 TaxID=2914832 RepID=UPI001F561293
LLGWREAEIVGESACLFFTEEDQALNVCDQEMMKAARSGRAEDERWHRRKGGTRFWASGLMMRFDADDSDEHIGYIKILRDRTPQHQAEQSLKDNQRQLETAMAVGKLGNWRLDVGTMRLTSCPITKAHFGKSRDAELSYGEWLAAVDEEDRDRVREAIRHALDSGEAYDAEYRVTWPDGTCHWVHARAQAHYADDRTPTALTGVTSDITERKRGEQALEQLALNLEHAVNARTADLTAANEQLRREIVERQQAEETLRQAQKMEAVGQLTGGVAHDFNNLLTIIRGSVDLLRRPGVTEERRERYIEAISETADRASALTGQLLAFARRQPLKPQVLAVADRMPGLTDMVRTAVGPKVEIDMEIADDAWPIMADPAQFDTALLNLAVNARDAMEGSGRLSFSIRNVDTIPARRGHAASSGEFVAIEVRDTGPGIPPALLDRVFEPFFTTKSVGQGTGLGLSQVIGFAKQSGGDIIADGVLEQGASFLLYLPRSHHQVATTPKQASKEPDAPRGEGCVLVVEDNSHVGEFATQMLNDLGYSTTWAASAQEALDLVQSHPDRFDAVFSDVVMPGMNGVEMALRLRETNPELPVVLASGYSQVLAEEGSHGFELLQKPYSVDKLSRTLTDVMRHKCDKTRARG